MRLGFILLWITSALILSAAAPMQQSDPILSPLSVAIKFGESITIASTIQTENQIDIQEAVLFLKPFNQDTRVYPLNYEQNQANLNISLDERPIRPFSRVECWSQLTLSTGQQFTSPVLTFVYEDNRTDWKRLNQAGIQISWIDGGLDFGQAVLNVTASSIEAVKEYLDASPPDPLQIYVYPSASELQSALQISDQPWVAGHASPDLGVILISISQGPDQRAEMERQIPHELMHIMQYQYAGKGSSRAPVWFVEGMASVVELYPNQDYQLSLNRAIEQNGLVPISEFCSSFPSDLSGAFLAYAESASFVRFLHDNFGSSGLTSLLDGYADGLGCAEGVQSVYGETLAQLEMRWQSEALGINPGKQAWGKIGPYVLLALFILLPIIYTLIPQRNFQKNTAEPQGSGEQY